MKKKLVIVSGPLAPYRVDLYEGIALELQDAWDVSLIYAAKQQEAHAWGDLFGQVKQLQLHYCPGIVISPWLRKWIGMFKGSPPQPNLPDLKLWQILKTTKPDVIWIAEYPAYCIAALLYGVLHDIPVVVHTEVGALTKPGILSSITRSYQKFWGNYLSGIVACSSEAMTPFNPSIDRLCLAPHAIHCHEYGPVADTQRQVPVILFVGNMIPRKGIDYLAQACGVLKKKGHAFVLRLLGGGDRAWAEEWFRKEDVSDRIEYGGFCEGEALRDEYRKASLFVLPSRHDTYGVVTHEAAASGLPVVISKHAGSSSILVEDGKTGYVIDPADLEQFSAALEKLVMDADLRDRFGKAGRTLAEEWALGQMAKKVSGFLKEFA